jgi:Type IV secretion system pilin
MRKLYYGLTAAIIPIIEFSQVSFVRAAMVFPTPPVGIPTGPIQGTGDVVNIFCTAIQWIFWLLIVLSVIMFLVGGYRYVTAAGEAERVSKANKTLLYAAIAVAVAVIAAGIPALVSSFIGGQYFGGACGYF